MRILFRRVAILAVGVPLLVVAAFSQAAQKPRAATSTKPKVLILGTSVNGGTSSLEAQKAMADGFAVKVVDGSQWDAMTTKQFKRYRALIIGDNTDSNDNADIQAAINNHNVWGRAITGNVILAGSDPGYHGQLQNVPGAQRYIAKAIAFAGHISGRTGLYFAGVYYHTGTPQRLTVLDGLKRNGFYWQTGLNDDNIHIDPDTTPKVHGLTDSTMSGWSSTAHAAFTKWPHKTFHVWAVGVNPLGNWTTSDHVKGWVHFLVRGKTP
jgi:hypothetical protein